MTSRRGATHQRAVGLPGAARDSGCRQDRRSVGRLWFGGWLWDPGLQCKVSVLDILTVVLSYGKDLQLFDKLFSPKLECRQTGVALLGLEEDATVQLDPLFDYS